MIMIIFTNPKKHLENKCLYVNYGVRIARKLRIVPANVSLGIFHLKREQIGFVEEENYWDSLKRYVIYYRVEDVLWFLQAIGFSRRKFSIFITWLKANFSFTHLSSASTWSNSEVETRKRIDVTEPSKHFVHFWRCVRWPPTSTNTNGMFCVYKKRIIQSTD